MLITTTCSAQSFQADTTSTISLSDTLVQDTTNLHKNNDSALVMISDTVPKKEASKSFIDEIVNYTASDSIILDIANQKAYLYNQAEVVYGNMQLKAGYIEIDFDKKTLYSKGITDSTGNITQKPVSKQDNEEFKAEEIAYNFDTKKGKIKNVITQQGGGYIHGRDIKKDSNDTYYVAHGKFTTCENEDPHFYIGANKIKVIPDDKIITGPAQLYIADIPTPLALPFGYFPNKKGRASGILLPTYGESTNWGFFLKDGGFYFGMSDHVDLALRGDIYANGSFALKAFSRYVKRYRYNGNLNLGFSNIIDGNRAFSTTTIKKDFNVKWNHTQDSKARPGTRFSANVNAGSNSYNKFNGDVNSSYLTNTLQSNISYSKSFTGTPFNFSANARHSQNTITKQLNLTLPELALTMSRIYPFKSSKRVSNKWYDKLGISASANTRNQINTYMAQAFRPDLSDTAYYNNQSINDDSTLFTNRTLEKMQNGILLKAPISTSINLLKYFTLTPSIATSSRIYFETIEKSFDSNTNQVLTDTIAGMKTAYDYSLSGNISTRIYGDYLFKSRYLKQIRHVLTPTFGANYKPDFSESQYGYYKTVQSDSLGNTTQYSIFQTGIYGSPSAGKSGTLSFLLTNSLEAKILQQSDSGATTKKIMLIDNLNFSSSYNIAADSLNWSPINLTARTLLFKKININTGATFDPYQVDVNGRRINSYEWNNSSYSPKLFSKRIGRLTSARAAVSTSLRSRDKTREKKEQSDIPEDQLDYINSHLDQYVDFSIPWDLSVSYNLQYSKSYTSETSTSNITQTASFNGDLRLTQKWKIGVRSGYDFTNKKLSLTSIDIYRDLHCWEMSFNWIPFGFRQSFSLNLNVKSAVLKDLKLSRRRNWQDY